MKRDIWDILGIAPTTDKKAIKRAYATQSHKYHPEDDPEGFLQLQQAYQKALSQTFSQSSTIPQKPSQASLSKSQPINVKLDDIEEKTLDVNYDDLEGYEDNIPDYDLKGQELFNDDIEIKDTINIVEYQNYIFKHAKQYIGHSMNLEKLKYILTNTNIMTQVEDEAFKKRIEDLLLSVKFHFKVKEANEVFRELRLAHFNKLADQLENSQKKKNNIRNMIVFSAMICIVVGNTLGLRNHETVTSKPDLEPVEVFTDDEEYQMNRVFFQGITVSKEENNYILKDKTGKELINKIEDIQYTNSSVIVFKKENQFYLYDTKDMLKDHLDYQNVVIVRIVEDGKDLLTRQLAVSQDKKDWKLCDLKGNTGLNIQGSLPNKTIPDVYIDNNQARFE